MKGAYNNAPTHGQKNPALLLLLNKKKINKNEKFFFSVTIEKNWIDSRINKNWTENKLHCFICMNERNIIIIYTVASIYHEYHQRIFIHIYSNVSKNIVEQLCRWDLCFFIKACEIYLHI